MLKDFTTFEGQTVWEAMVGETVAGVVRTKDWHGEHTTIVCQSGHALNIDYRGTYILRPRLVQQGLEEERDRIHKATATEREQLTKVLDCLAVFK